ncbi:MAG TPA: hypothetical protein EYP14_03605, partial [Planctomycetaceae bacterium]|nr:hypothetical protein [Planctomycetaceae bacterium]
MDRLKSMFWIVALTGGLCRLPVAGDGSAQAAQPGSAVTDLTQVDVDFWFMGEYTGEVLLGTGQRQPIGLQVVPLGDGRFFAVEYEG